jgi:hypothetical protein
MEEDKEICETIQQCPDCGAVLIHQEGCVCCENCGYSPCG